MKRIIILISLVSVIPVCGYLIGSYIEYDFRTQWIALVGKELGDKGIAEIKSGRLALEIYCDDPESVNDKACQTFKNIILLKDASAFALFAGLALVLTIFLAARLSASSRELLYRIFTPGVKISLIILFFIILIQGAIATYSAYIFEVTVFNRVHIFIIGAIGIGAIVGAFSMINAGLTISKRASTNVIGKILTIEDEPGIWHFVNEIAGRLGAASPKNIVVGLKPTFYITSADVNVFPGSQNQLTETLYLSLPLMRILSYEEIAAVIGHELGHYRGEDTKYSLKFYPIYSGITQALIALEENSTDGIKSLALLPGFSVLSFLIDQFARAERAIGRERELEADKIGALVSSSKDLATSLLKVSIYAPVWDSIQSVMISELNEGKAFKNISSLYAEVVVNNNSRSVFDEIESVVIEHPTDTHPPTLTRIQALGLSIDDLYNSVQKISIGKSSIDLISNSGLLKKS
jgi:Zn-dependent protease with chaperone function